MATKTIPQLTLRASLTDSSMFEIDDGIQSYRITATQIVEYLETKELITAAAMISSGVVTEVKLASDAVSTAKILNLAVTAAKLDESFVHDLTGVTPVAADYLALADASDSNKKKKASVGLIRNAVYRSVTSTDSVGVDDETMKLSGASFTSTLPTAAGVAGKRYKFIHAGTSFSMLYTLATTSAQTIGGVASGSYILNTNGEVLEIESDGANWIIVGRITDTGWLAYPAAPTITGFGTVANVSCFFRRNSNFFDIRGFFTAGTLAAALPKMTLPGGKSIDSTKVSATLTSYLGTWIADVNATQAVVPSSTRGPFSMYYNSTDAAAIYVTDTVDSDTSIFVNTRNASTMFASNGANHTFQAFGIPIAGLQP